MPHVRKAVSSILLLMIILSFTSFTTEYVKASSQVFKLITYNYKSSAGTDNVYPGSRNVLITVEVQYVGNTEIVGVSGSIQLPTGFTISRGYQSSSPPYTPNGTTYSVVKPGDVIIFKYSVDVSKEVSPGNYSFSIEIRYRPAHQVTSLQSQRISGITMTVSGYPQLKLNIVDTYWSPDAYPGSEGVSLNIVLENDGESTIISAHASISFPGIIEPRNVKVNLGTISKNERVTVTLTGLNILLNVTPNYRYYANMEIQATARTDDNVDYETSTTIPIAITVSPAPHVRIKVIDYGLTAPYSVSGLEFSKIYITLQNMDFATINAITAVFNVENESFTFINESRTSIVTLQGTYNYGDYITIESDKLLINSNVDGVILANLTLTIFGSKDGAEFWSIQSFNLKIPISKPKMKLFVAAAYWSTQEVYPGSDDQTFNIVIENLDTTSFIDGVAVLKLPSLFTPSVITLSGITVDSASRTTLTFPHINIASTTRPGVYIALLELNGLAKANDGSSYKVSVKLPVTVTISNPNLKVFSVADYGWYEGRAYTTSCNVNAYVSLRVISPVTTHNILVRVVLPPQLTFMDNRRVGSIVISESYGYGEVFKVDVGPLNVTTAMLGTVPIVVMVNALVDVHGSSTWVNEEFIIPLKVEEPALNVTLVDSGWYEGFSSNESYGVTAYITIQSLHMDRIDTMIITMKPNTSDITFRSGENIGVWVGQNTLNYGGVITATFSNIDVHTNATQVPVTFRVECIVTSGNSYYKAYRNISTYLKLVKEDNSFIIAEATILYQGEYAPLLPTAHDVTWSLTLINIRSTTISSVDVDVELPEGFKLKGISGSCLNGVAGGSSCSLNVHMDLDNVTPGIYPAKISLKYFKKVGNAIVKFTQTIHLNLVVESLEIYMPKLIIVTSYWGRDGPVTVFEHERNVPLTLIIMNIGRYAVEGVKVELKSLNSTVRFITSSSYCTARLEPGATCRATVYLDLANVSAGNLYLKAYIMYLFREFGAHKTSQQIFLISLPVERFAGGKGLEIVDSGWQNDWPVYPNTENATFTITLANKWPYRVSGLKLKLYLPSGFTSTSGNYSTCYISGPIDSLATVTSSFTVSVGNVTPGRYEAKLTVEYVVECGGSQLLKRQEFSINIIIHSLKESIQFISSTWYRESPEAEAYGSLLLISIRNNYVPQMNGPILEIYLPPGFTCAINNESYAKILPYTQALIATQAGNTPSYQTLLSQLPQILITSSLKANQYAVSEGQIVSFLVPLNVLTKNAKTYYATAYLNFIDHWGNIRRIKLEVPIRVFGSTKIVDVYLPKSIKIINGSAILPVTIINKGSSSIYETYVYIVPQAPLAIPVENLKYIGKVNPNSNATVTFNLLYNPTSITSSGLTVQYTSLPLILTVRYKDVLGYPHLFNISLAVLIEPFIDLRLAKDVKAELRGYSLIVSGTIINYGLATARSVEVKVIVEDGTSSSFIGDIDPASQSAFRIEMKLYRRVEKVKLEVTCQDDYGIVHKSTAIVPVEVIPLTTTTPEQKPPIPLGLGYIIVLIIVAAFLIVVAILLHRYLKKHSKVYEEEVSLNT